MFMPQAQPLARSHGAPGTVRRGGRDKENSALPSKTPSHQTLGKPGQSSVQPLGAKTPGPVLGGKTPAPFGKTPFGKTPGVLGNKTFDRNVQQPAEEIEPKRLFQNTKAAGPSKAAKTPAPRRALQTPAPRRLEIEPTPAPLPSAQRTRRRSRSSLLQHTPPAWEEEVSLDSIVEAEIEAVVELEPESDYEMEYCPPKEPELRHVPEWADSIPDPVKSLAAIANLPVLGGLPIPLEPPSPPSFDHEFVSVKLCSDDELEHPLFRRKKPQVEERRPLSAKPVVGGNVRPVARPAAAPGKPSISTVRRPPATTSRMPSATRPTSASAARSRTTTPSSTPSVTAPRTTKPERPASAVPLRAVASRIESRPRPASSTQAPLRAPGNAGSKLQSTLRTATAQPVPVLRLKSPPSPGLEDMITPAEDDFLDLDLDVLDLAPPTGLGINTLELTDAKIESEMEVLASPAETTPHLDKMSTNPSPAPPTSQTNSYEMTTL